MPRRDVIEAQKGLPGSDPSEIDRQEALRQGYVRGVEPSPPVRNVGGGGVTSEPDISKEERRKRKIAAGIPLGQEDL